MNDHEYNQNLAESARITKETEPHIVRFNSLIDKLKSLSVLHDKLNTGKPCDSKAMDDIANEMARVTHLALCEIYEVWEIGGDAAELQSKLDRIV